MRGRAEIDQVGVTGVRETSLGLSDSEASQRAAVAEKPANVMVTARGQVRVMDFGLAKFTMPAAVSATAVETASALTGTGSTLGTAGYMSPEQARGVQADARSDLFSLGVVMYEMVTGQRLFAGPTIADTLVAVLGHDPAPLRRMRPDTPEELDRIVSKLLRKDREERYQSATDLLVDLRALLKRIQGAPTAGPLEAPAANRLTMSPAFRSRWMTVAAVAAAVLIAISGYATWRNRDGTSSSSAPAAVPPIASLAVLPLTNVSADPAQDYFVAALTDELTRALSGIRSLRVVSRTSTAQFKDTTLSMKEIAAALGVDGLIEGSVVRDGERVRINAKLIHGSSDRHLWANAYDGELRGMLDLQRRVAEAIAVEVRATVTPDEQLSLRARRAIDPAAMDLYLKGREFLYHGNSTPAGFVPAALEQAIVSFTEALKLEPDWAEPHAGLASAQHWLATGGFDSHVRFPAAREAALRAIRFDDRLADAHGALAYVSFTYDWNLDLAEREYRRAIDLGSAPNYSIGFSKLLQSLGRFDEARDMMDLAQSRNPLSAVVKLELAQLSLMSRKYDEAIERAAAIPESFGTNIRHLIVGQALLLKGQPEKAIPELEQGNSAAHLASALARAGRAAEARTRLREFERGARTGTDQVGIASVYVSLGEPARALEALERAFEAKAIWLPLINVNPAFDDLRRETGFVNLLRRLGMPDRR